MAAFGLLGIDPGAPAEAIRAARRMRLRQADGLADAVRDAARTALAAKATGGTGPVTLIDIWSEGMSAAPGLEAVA